MARHWNTDDFVQTVTTPAYDGSAALNRFGYCRVCKGDMQSFGHQGKNGPLLHHNSHKHAKRAGVWGRHTREVTHG